MSSVDNIRVAERLDRLLLGLLGGLVAAVSIAFAHGYGYHRDELYFLVAGRHLAWSYPDQGPVTPFIARVMSAIAPHSLTVLRIPSALEIGATVFLTGVIALELGARRRAQLIAAGCTAVGAVFLATAHLLSTTTFDLLAWTVVTWLIAHAVRTGAQRLWLVTGVVAGIALLNKPLIAFLLFAVAVGLLLAAPREVLRSRWPWLGLAIAVALWLPWLVWQARHGWPQLHISSSIAQGGSASSQPRWALLPFQLLLVSPVLAPVWIAGLVALLRRERLRRYRFFAVAWLVLAVVFIAAGGKPYYLAGLFPVLLGAGAISVDSWLGRGSRRLRGALLTVAFVGSAFVSALIAFPLLPARDAGAVIALDSDVGETIGWPDFTRIVAHAYHAAPGTPVVFTSNYGEAGAIDRFGPALDLPGAYSGHNGFSEWGPPPDRPGSVVVVGLDRADLHRFFRSCRLAMRVSNSAGVDNDEHGEPVYLCAGVRGTWSQAWRALRHYG
jgi:4-amino-4-deoxy-L-arabinose transferase-like glycosyltransferase